MMNGPFKILSIILLLAFLPALALADAGDPKKGEEIYQKRCWWCHGEDGAGDGPAADRLIPPPRDFSMGIYKFKSTPFEEIIPSDDDFFQMIKGEVVKNSFSNWTGMNDSSMPGWGDILSDQDIWDLIAFIKALVEYEAPEQGPISLANKVATSEESIAKGKEKFKDVCEECHGELGRGDGTKKLKDDSGFRTWPRNLTKPWTFRMTNGAEGIYTRITTSIQGTQMPSFADPISKKKLSEEERWHVANYVATLDAPYKKPGTNTVIKAFRLEGDVPSTPDDPTWAQAEHTSFYLVPQIVGKERHFTPSLNSITAKVIYNSTDLAILLEWDDRTKSIPGDEKAEEIAGDELYIDSVAVQLPVRIPTGTEKPYYRMGDASYPVNLWKWKSETTTEGQSLQLINAKGFLKQTSRDPSEAGLISKGVYDNGTWRVVIKRPLLTDKKDSDIQFEEGRFIPIAFAAWDGSNGEKGSKYVYTTWYWLLLKPPTDSSVFLIPFIVAMLIFGGELLLLWTYKKK